MMLLKCCTQYTSKFGKLSSGRRIGKGQFSFKSLRRVMSKNVQTTIQSMVLLCMYLLHMLVRLCWWSFKLGFTSMWIENFQSLEQPEFRKGRGTRDQIASIHWIMEKAREFQKNIYFCFIDYTKAFDWVTASWSLWLWITAVENS